MTQFPALPLFTDAYLGDTTHLSTIEHGAYLLLLLSMWRNGGSLPSDDQMLLRYTKLRANQWRAMKPVILAFFVQEGGRITQARLSDELELARERSKSQQHKAKARWLKNKNGGLAGALPQDEPGGSRGNTTPTQSPTQTPTQTPLRRSSPRSTHAREGEHEPDWLAEVIPAADLDDSSIALHERVLTAVGLQSRGQLPAYWMPPSAVIHVAGWRDLGLNDDEIVEVARQSRRKYPEPPDGPKALDRLMQITANVKNLPKLEPITPGGGYDRPAASEKADRLRRIAEAAARGTT